MSVLARLRSCSRIIEMLTGLNLPDEAIQEILARLPAKSLGQYKCVSKPWRTLISHPSFIKSHLSLNRRREKLLARSEEWSLSVVDLNGGEPFVSSTKLDFKQTQCWYDVYGSCNGLVLARGLRYQLYLLNPTTLECKKLPRSPGIVPLFDRKSCGLGYDSLSDDYKVVVVSQFHTVYVYSLKSNSWKRVQDSPIDNFLDIYRSTPVVFSNGFIHWFGSISSSQMIAAFDLVDEKFREVPMPPISGFPCRPVVVGGYLCMTNEFDKTDIWVWKEYGVYEYESWIKFSVLPLPSASGVKILFLVGDEEFVLDIDGNTVSYNMKEKRTRDIVAHGLSGELDYKCTFVESLVSPFQLH